MLRFLVWLRPNPPHPHHVLQCPPRHCKRFESRGTTRIYTIVGNICETDTLGYDRKLTEVREWDMLLIKNTEVYGSIIAH